MTDEEDLPAEALGARVTVTSADLLSLNRIAYNTAYKVLFDREFARDVSQDTMAALLATKSILNNRDAWVTAVSKNLSITLLRAKSREEIKNRRTGIPQDGDTGREHEQLLDRLVVEEHMADLSPREFEAMKLWFFDDLDNPAIATRMGISVDTVKTLLRRARAKVRDSITATRRAEVD